MLVTPAGIVTLVRLLHPSNAFVAMLVTKLEITTALPEPLYALRVIAPLFVV